MYKCRSTRVFYCTVDSYPRIVSFDAAWYPRHSKEKNTTSIETMVTQIQDYFQFLVLITPKNGTSRPRNSEMRDTSNQIYTCATEHVTRVYTEYLSKVSPMPSNQ